MSVVVLTIFLRVVLAVEVPCVVVWDVVVFCVVVVVLVATVIVLRGTNDVVDDSSALGVAVMGKLLICPLTFFSCISTDVLTFVSVDISNG